MPKLSKYVQEASQQHPDVAAEPGTLYLATDAAAGPAAPAGRPAASTRSTLGGSSQGGRSTLLSPQHQAAAAKLKEDFNKRIREHGPRVFRWPDGSLRPDKPPPSPYAAVCPQHAFVRGVFMICCGARVLVPLPGSWRVVARTPVRSGGHVTVPSPSLIPPAPTQRLVHQPHPTAGQPQEVATAGAALPHPRR